MNIAVIFAGGTGTRMQSRERPKQFLEMCDKPIIVRTIQHFEDHPMIDAVVVVCIEEWIGHFEKLRYQYRLDKVKKTVTGGATGQLSIYHGLKAAKEIAKDEKAIVLIHDGVRPLINEHVITDNIESVRQFDSAITTAPVTETILVVDETDSTIRQVPNRKDSRTAKAPQSFWLDDILAAHENALANGITDCIDSCTMMNSIGRPLHLIDGPAENIKITTPVDFYVARAILETKENAQIYGFDK